MQFVHAVLENDGFLKTYFTR